MNSFILVTFHRIKEKVSKRKKREKGKERKEGKEREEREEKKRKGKARMKRKARRDRKIPKESEISEAISRLRIGAWSSCPFSLGTSFALENLEQSS